MRRAKTERTDPIMTEFVVKNQNRDIAEACLRVSALTFSKPINDCRVRKCRRNLDCAGEMIASDGRLEALAAAQHMPAPWLSGGRIPPCLANMYDWQLEFVTGQLPRTYDNITSFPDHATSCHFYRMGARMVCRARSPHNWPKKPA